MLKIILRRWFSLKLRKNKINCFIVRKNQIQQHNVQGTYNTIKELYLFYSSSLIIICCSVEALIFWSLFLPKNFFQVIKLVSTVYSLETHERNLNFGLRIKMPRKRKQATSCWVWLEKTKQNMFLIILYCKIVLRVLIKKIWPDPYLKSRFLFVAHY